MHDTAKDAKKIGAKLGEGPGLGFFEGMKPRQVLQIILNAERLAKRKRDPAWVFVHDLFAVGSTVAFNLCRHAGIDPDLTVAAARRARNG